MQMNKGKLYGIIDEQRDQIIDFVRSMIATGPVNPAYNKDRNEIECQEIVRKRIATLPDIEIESFDVSLDKLEPYRGLPGFVEGFTDLLPWHGRPNILARWPGSDPSKGRSIILTGHSDVVAADDVSAWKYHPFSATIEDGVLYGRGAVDMLSGLGCMVMAMEAIAASGLRPRGDIWFGSAVGEEAGGTGFLAIADHIRAQGYRIDAGIMGEPTNLDLSLLCRGIQWGEIEIRGRTGHLEVTQPHWRDGGVVDAIQKARWLMDCIDELNKDWSLRPDKNHPLLTESCEVKIAKIEGGHHLSSYPEYCKLSFNIQVLPHEADENGLGMATRREFEDFINRVANADPWLRLNPPKIKWVLEADCSEVPESHPFVSVCQHAAADTHSRMKTLGSGFHTDTGWLARLGDIPIVNFGPGNPMQAHVTNEHCKVDDIIVATKIIASTCVDWCE